MFYNEKVEKWQITEPLSQVTNAVDDYTIRFEFDRAVSEVHVEPDKLARR